jgi:uncharacterized protein with HEPN domain
MSKRDNLLLADDIIDSLKAIMEFTQSKTYDDFINDRMCRDAVIRNFEVIGEASNYISPEFKIDHPEVEWRKMTDLRNRFIHHYFGIDYEIVWRIIKDEVFNYLEYLQTYIK